MYFWLNCKVYHRNLMTIVIIITYEASLIVIIHVSRLHSTHTGLSMFLMKEKVNSLPAYTSAVMARFGAAEATLPGGRGLEKSGRETPSDLPWGRARLDPRVRPGSPTQ